MGKLYFENCGKYPFLWPHNFHLFFKRGSISCVPWDKYLNQQNMRPCGRCEWPVCNDPTQLIWNWILSKYKKDTEICKQSLWAATMLIIFSQSEIVKDLFLHNCTNAQLHNCTITQLHNCTYLWLHPAPHSRIRSDATESSTKSSFWPFTLVIILIRMVKLVKFNLVIILMRMVGDVGGETWSIETQPRSPEFTPTPGATFTWNQHNCHHHNYDHRHQLAKSGPHRSKFDWGNIKLTICESTPPT